MSGRFFGVASVDFFVDLGESDRLANDEEVRAGTDIGSCNPRFSVLCESSLDSSFDPCKTFLAFGFAVWEGVDMCVPAAKH